MIRYPEILTHPNIPKPLHGLNPRSLLGDAWWDEQRHAAYRRAKYHCMACGVPKSKAKYHQWLEAHEYYSYDYGAGKAKLIQIVALCHLCHNFIHSGRVYNLYKDGKIERSKVDDIFYHGFKVLRDNGLKPWWGTAYTWLLLREYSEESVLNWLDENGYDRRVPAMESDWSKWHLEIPGHGLHYSKFRSMKEWKDAMFAQYGKVTIGQRSPYDPTG